MGGAGPRVLLAWARDRDGAKTDAARLVPGDRRVRAPFTCLGCGEVLVPHLGRIRARHFAHRPGSSCPLTAPETALHFDAKERLLALCEAAFSGARKVTLLARCKACRRPTPLDLSLAGDAAVEEGAVGALRADVLVLRLGRPALAIEVAVTHAVEPAKEEALGAAGVPAVEVDARAEWEREGPAGTEIACARSLGFPKCPACAALARSDEDRGRGGEAAEVAELEAYRARGLFGNVSAAAGDLRAIAARFRCPECGGTSVEMGKSLVRHACPGKGARPIAWRGYDGLVAELSWWRRTPRGAPGK